jgi:uncharacterized SAM-binding protein YcdF (DUF218 family)
VAKHPHAGRSGISSRLKKTRGPTHRPSVWAGAISIFLLLLIAGIRFYGDNLYDYPENPALPSLQKDTAIVCLAGGKYRIEAAFSLYANGVGERLFIVGAGPKATKDGLAKLQAVETAQKIPWDRFDRIVVENESRNTFENALVVKSFLEQHPQVKKILLVTSSYHMRRAEFMIASQIPADVQIIPFTPMSGEVGKQNWWQSWLGISLTVEEYTKLWLLKVLLPMLGYF